MKRKLFYIIPLSIIGSIACLAVLLVLTLTVLEYRPKAIEEVPFTSGTDKIELYKPVSILSWNIGYSGLGKEEDFFMDGGKKVRPDSKKIVERYYSGIRDSINANPADILFIQEIDIKSKRTWKMNEFEALKRDTGKCGSFAYNFKCVYVPLPIPTIGKVASGVSVLTNLETTKAERIALPVAFKWPVCTVNLKRCILATRVPVYENGNDTGKELVLADFHLEAYDNGEGKIAQTKVLMSFLESEYEKGNYVIAGGDFNQKFPSSEAFPPIWYGWLPGSLSDDMLKPGWQFVYDDSKPTCRSLEYKYNDEAAANHEWQYYVLDGFLVSPNVNALSVDVIDLDFQNSDHNPVHMTFELN